MPPNAVQPLVSGAVIRIRGTNNDHKVKTGVVVGTPREDRVFVVPLGMVQGSTNQQIQPSVDNGLMGPGWHSRPERSATMHVNQIAGIGGPVSAAELQGIQAELRSFIGL
jgi:hypothetical protein